MPINLRMALATTTAVIVMVGAIGTRAPRAAQERTFPIPMSLVQEHAEVTTALNAAAKLPGDTGAAARRVLALVAPHMKDEQRSIFRGRRRLLASQTVAADHFLGDVAGMSLAL